MATTKRHRVVIIGAGFGGLAAARALRSAPVDVTIIDANNFHTFQPLLYQVATSGLSDDDVAHPIRKVFRPTRFGARWWPRGRTNVTVKMGRVVDIDTATTCVHLADGRTIHYDSLIVAAGAVSHDFGVTGVDEHAFGLKSVDDAMRLRTHVLANVERAAKQPAEIAPGALDIVVAGGGPTGVEMAGGLSELYRMVLADDFSDLPIADARITLVEMADRVLTPFTETSSRRAATALRELGVELRTGVGIAEVRADGVTLSDGSTIDAATTVWATGVRAHPLAAALGIELGSGGRIPVGSDLSVAGCDGVFAIGDIADVRDDEGAPLPQVAQPAIQGGKYVASQIIRQLNGEPTQPFAYFDKGSMATIGRHSAVAELPNGWAVGGFIGWVAWLGLHLVYLMGFRNRLSVFVNWSWNYLTYDRASRLLSDDDVAGDRRPHRIDS